MKWEKEWNKMSVKKAKRATYGKDPIVLPVGTAVFTQFLDKVNSDQGEYPSNKYEICVAYPPGTDFSAAKTAIQEVITAEFGEGVTMSDLDNVPFRDGNEMNTEKYPIFKDSIYIQPRRRAASGPIPCFAKDKVGDSVPEIAPSEIYAGCKVKLFVTIGAATINKKTRMCWFNVEAVQFMGDGERLSGATVTQLLMSGTEELQAAVSDTVEAINLAPTTTSAPKKKKSSLLDAI